MGIGAGGEPKAGSSIHWSKKVAIVCSLKHRRRQSVCVRLRRSLATVSHQV